ncbi:MAG: HEPN domain-containing protein [Sulfurimonas sp.]|nr:HEPN domain-containing protein [Sulfurimonas sp.]
MLKSMLAFTNSKIPKTHDLFEIYEQIDELQLEESEIILLYCATEYFKEDRYPNPNYCLPPKEEIKLILDFTEELFYKICKILNIEKNLYVK